MSNRLFNRRTGKPFYTVPPEAGEPVAMTVVIPDHILLVDCERAVLVVDLLTNPPSVDCRMLDASTWALPGGI